MLNVINEITSFPPFLFLLLFSLNSTGIVYTSQPTIKLPAWFDGVFCCVLFHVHFRHSPPPPRKWYIDLIALHLLGDFQWQSMVGICDCNGWLWWLYQFDSSADHRHRECHAVWMAFVAVFTVAAGSFGAAANAANAARPPDVMNQRNDSQMLREYGHWNPHLHILGKLTETVALNPRNRHLHPAARLHALKEIVYTFFY